MAAPPDDHLSSPGTPAPEPGPTGDDGLMRRVQAGDLQALEALMERKRWRAFRLARHVVGSQEDARDVVQLAFIRVWRAASRYRPGSGFDPWFHSIVMRLAIDLRRRERVRRRSAAEAASGGAAPGALPTAALGRREVARVFEDLARDLSPRQRAVFALREIEGMDGTEVARVLGLRPSTVRNHLFQARRILQRGLRRRYPEYLPGGGRRGRS